jgi:malate permease and related proteins
MNTLADLARTFANNLLPIILVSGAGYLLGKYLAVEPRAVGRLVFYFFSPLLIFNLLIHSSLDTAEIVFTAGAAAAVILGVALVAGLGGLALRLDRRALVSVVIAAMFANNGNYGLPLISFAFGADALARSSVYFVTSVILYNTVGVLIASLGHLSLKQAGLGLLRVPAIYAVLAAFVVMGFGLTVPLPIDRTVSLVASGTIPLMLILLGLELQRSRWTQNLRALSLASAARMVVGPLIGLAVLALAHRPPVSDPAVMVESAMPSAVANTVLASEYDLDAGIITATIFVTTLISPLTLTWLIVLLK